MTDFKSYFHSKYQGGEDFIRNVILPIFGEDRYENAYQEDVLENNQEFKKKAQGTGVSKILRLGTIEIPMNPTYVFDITVSDQVQMRRNRVAVQQLIRSVMSTYSSAFMIFHYSGDDKWDWRFTFCSKQGSNQDSTDSKRYTFLLGPNQSCRTAAENFKKLADKGGNIELSDIVQAFDVEALSKEFFTKYKVHYDKFCQFVYDNKDNREYFGQEFSLWEDKVIRDYVKKLLGRIVFLHFLQKKGWLGVPSNGNWGDGDTQFMKHLFEASSDEQKSDYLDTVLEPLFSKALNASRENDVYNLKVPGFTDTKIPYLNGGLFEKDELDIPKSKFPADYFADLFEFFYEYNFTIDENDPDDAEVGIDPEMLGRIFENLLEDNKDKGIYYTPKEIVQYMCRESLVAYLTTCVIRKHGDKCRSEEEVQADVRKMLNESEASKEQFEDFGTYIRNVKICDPAIGSGAFPMGLLNELVRCRASINAWATDEKGAVLSGDYAALKAEIINNNIYGVDIEKGAIDIAKLRFWLSIVVDEQTPHTLPNFDYKFVKGNSLISTFAGEYVNIAEEEQMPDLMHVMNDLANKVIKAKKKFYNADGILKQELAVEIKLLTMQMVALRLDSVMGWTGKQISLFDLEENREVVDYLMAKRKILDSANFIVKQLQDKSIPIEQRNKIDIKFFDWYLEFPEVLNVRDAKGKRVGGFDIVIGNPPYIKEYVNREAFNGFREKSPYYVGKMDLWHGFACHCIDMLKENGVITFIAQNNWTTNDGAKLLRKKIVEDAKILQMIDFNDYMVFGESASIQTMIMMFMRDSVSNDYTLDFRRLSPSSTKIDMLNILSKIGHHTFLSPVFNREYFTDKFITFSENDSLLFKIASKNERLADDEVAQGIVFPQDFLNRKGQMKLHNFNIGDGIFGLTDAELNNLNLSNCEKSLIRPYYTSEQIHRYFTDEGNNTLWMIYTDSKYRDKNSMDNYPSLKAHLDKFKAIFTSDNKPYGLHRARKESFFSGEKIISLRKCVGYPLFSYSQCDCYVSQTFFSIKTNRWDMKFLTGVLNSKLIAFWLKNKGKMQGQNYQIDKEPLLAIPLPSTECSQQPIANLVSDIIESKKANPQADTSALEAEIDRLVYDLYGLTDDEIAIIEETNN